VVVNKTPQNQQRLTDYKGVIDDNDIEIDEDFPQPPASMTIVDLTREPSIEELSTSPIAIAGTSMLPRTSQTANNTSSHTKVSDADYDEDVIIDDEDHYDIVDPNDDDDEDDVGFLADDTDHRVKPKKHKGTY
jgi:hypothetical protein